MFIVPFLYKVTEWNHMNIHSIHLLTIGGKQLWEEDSHLDKDKDILEVNDMYRKGEWIQPLENVSLCEVDSERTNIGDFYQWKEVSVQDEDTFCWRNYVYITGSNQESWLDIPRQEKIGKYSLEKLIRFVIQKKSCEIESQKVI